jgi:inosose dehydratase
MTQAGARFARDAISLGVTPTLWWNDDFPELDAGITFGQAVSEMALAGFEGCSVGHKYPTEPAVLATELGRRGLRVSEPWTSTFFTLNEMHDRTVADFHRSLDFIRAMNGTDVVVAELGRTSHTQPVALAPNRAVFDDEQWAALASGLDELGKIARDEGMRLCYHHHMGTGVQTRADVDRLMAMTDPDLVHLLLDTGHIHFAGDDPLSLADAYAERISHVHLKNIRQPVMDEALANGYSFEEAIKHGVFTVPGDPEGCIDFEAILNLLADRGYRGWLVVEAEQDPSTANPLDYARTARAYLRDVLGF